MTRKADFSVADCARALRASIKVPGKWEVAIEPGGTIVIREAVGAEQEDDNKSMDTPLEIDLQHYLTPTEIPDDKDNRVFRQIGFGIVAMNATHALNSSMDNRDFRSGRSE